MARKRGLRTPLTGAVQLAEIRQEYARKVAVLREVANKMLAERHSEEFVARTVHHMRRELGQQYKHLTPLPQRLMIYVRNIAPRWMGGAGYDSIWASSVEWLRTKARPSWADIIESASRSNQAINQRFGVR